MYQVSKSFLSYDYSMKEECIKCVIMKARR